MNMEEISHIYGALCLKRNGVCLHITVLVSFKRKPISRVRKDLAVLERRKAPVSKVAPKAQNEEPKYTRCQKVRLKTRKMMGSEPDSGEL